MADILDARGVAHAVHGATQATLGGRLRVATHLTGAAISLGLMVGIAIWGYRIMVRDVTGIPVVRAVEGPMRVQPENPGGDPADHQGLAVNAVAADGTAEAPADRLVLAPRPVELEDEDLPKPGLAEQEVAEVAAEAAPATQSEIDTLIAGLVTLQAGGDGPIVQPAPLVFQEVTQAAADLPSEPSGTAALPDDTPGVARSLRPRLRPAAAAASGPERVVTASAPADIEVSPADVPVGTRVVQFGAFDTPDVARAEWDRLAARFGDYLAGKQRIVQEAASGGRTFYRLRAMGFVDLSDARRFCSALVAEGADCIPVVTR